MAFGQLDRSGGAQPMHEINVTPLVDVMLVLLVVFIIATPLLTHKVKVNLPKTAAAKNVTQQKPLTISLDRDQRIYFDNQNININELQSRLKPLAATDPQLAVELRADGELSYQHVIRVIAAIQNAGVTRLAFITQPGGNSGLTPPN